MSCTSVGEWFNDIITNYLSLAYVWFTFKYSLAALGEEFICHFHCCCELFPEFQKFLHFKGSHFLSIPQNTFYTVINVLLINFGMYCLVNATLYDDLVFLTNPSQAIINFILNVPGLRLFHLSILFSIFFDLLFSIAELLSQLFYLELHVSNPFFGLKVFFLHFIHFSTHIGQHFPQIFNRVVFCWQNVLHLLVFVL